MLATLRFATKTSKELTQLKHAHRRMNVALCKERRKAKKRSSSSKALQYRRKHIKVWHGGRVGAAYTTLAVNLRALNCRPNKIPNVVRHVVAFLGKGLRTNFKLRLPGRTWHQKTTRMALSMTWVGNYQKLTMPS
eukprot:TRINITY_DN2908_c0_g1_i10.p2 TRINITY_DN2908_c0_g1~~TRINITY_DN2908_c0_g1_i10.p2  ORF type:complete len:135 (+),score=15.47 TRINITY_DN2908_c0_g1_i10:878-1282(+)